MSESEQLPNGVTLKQIDVTRDTNDPVFRATHDTAELTFIFPSTRDHDMIIHTVRSGEKGGMKTILDVVCTEYECEYLRFSTPLSDQLPNALHGFEHVTETIEDGPMAGSVWECLDGYWEADSS